MNPHAKEFVPAHLMKRRQEQETAELTEKVGQVGLEEAPSNSVEGAKSSQTSSGGDQNGSNKSAQDNQNLNTYEHHNNHSDNVNNTNLTSHHNNTNGEKKTSDLEGSNEEDRHLLKAGETYCEFNGEQFIIPGEDDEYEPDIQEYNRKAGYDFGNAEDNDDEDVCNAYEQFLDNLPE